MSDVPVPSHLPASHAFGALALAIFDDVMKPRNGGELNSTLVCCMSHETCRRQARRPDEGKGLFHITWVLELRRSSIDNNTTYRALLGAICACMGTPSLVYHMTHTSCCLRTDPLSMGETAYGDVSSPIR
jgi:hypothetical protein